jgi:hypothetical protein
MCIKEEAVMTMFQKSFMVLAVTAALAADAAFGDGADRSEGLFRCQVHRGGGRDTRPDNSLETRLDEIRLR